MDKIMVYKYSLECYYSQRWARIKAVWNKITGDDFTHFKIKAILYTKYLCLIYLKFGHSVANIVPLPLIAAPSNPHSRMET